ncbi:MAG: four helix bundle protein [Candidatus Pacebacteria bacterium]|nr:four helix bundle protein [Candidatus Paceibacterota bacterium]
MRRAAVSIPSNIAEGRLRSTEKDFRKFLYIAYSSGGELETQIEIAKRLPRTRNLNYNTAEELLTEVMKMLYTMINNRKDVSKTKR